MSSAHGQEDESNGSRGKRKTDMKQTKPLSISIGPMKNYAGIYSSESCYLDYEEH
jgi:hypothetical protein